MKLSNCYLTITFTYKLLFLGIRKFGKLNRSRHHLKHALLFLCPTYSHYRNEDLHNINYCVINKNVTVCSGLPYVLLCVYFFLFSILCSGTAGTGVLRPADILGSEVSDIYFEKCCVIIVVWDVT